MKIIPQVPFIIVLLVSLILPGVTSGQAPTGTRYITTNYDKLERYIPMRDGARLFTSIYVPKNISKKYPK